LIEWGEGESNFHVFVFIDNIFETLEIAVLFHNG
jgi:hypothetical protein